MKSVLKISNMRTMEDVSSIRKVISANEGVVACQINIDKQEANIVYDTYFLNVDDIIESLEDCGYTVI